MKQDWPRVVTFGLSRTKGPCSLFSPEKSPPFKWFPTFFATNGSMRCRAVQFPKESVVNFVHLAERSTFVRA